MGGVSVKLKHFIVKSQNMHNCVCPMHLLSLPLWHGLTCVLNMTGQFVIVLGQSWVIIHFQQVNLSREHTCEENYG